MATGRASELRVVEHDIENHLNSLDNYVYKVIARCRTTLQTDRQDLVIESKGVDEPSKRGGRPIFQRAPQGSIAAQGGPGELSWALGSPEFQKSARGVP